MVVVWSTVALDPTIQGKLQIRELKHNGCESDNYHFQALENPQLDITQTRSPAQQTQLSLDTWDINLGLNSL